MKMAKNSRKATLKDCWTELEILILMALSDSVLEDDDEDEPDLIDVFRGQRGDGDRRGDSDESSDSDVEVSSVSASDDGSKSDGPAFESLGVIRARKASSKRLLDGMTTSSRGTSKQDHRDR